MGKEKPQKQGVDIRSPVWKKVLLRVESVQPGLLMDRHPGEEQKSPTEKNVPDEVALERALHRLSNPVNGSQYGIPASAFQASVINAGRWSDFDITKVRGAIMVIPQPDGYIPIREEGWVPYAREVLLGPGKGRKRKVSPVFPKWQCDLLVEYMENFIGLGDVIMLFNIAGKSVGVGGFTPRSKSGGPYGRFVVKGYKELGEEEVAA